MDSNEGCSATLRNSDGHTQKQVLAVDGFAFSFERVGGVLVGTHVTLTDRQQQLLVSRLDALADEWAKQYVS